MPRKIRTGVKVEGALDDKAEEAGVGNFGASCREQSNRGSALLQGRP